MPGRPVARDCSSPHIIPCPAGQSGTGPEFEAAQPYPGHVRTVRGVTPMPPSPRPDPQPGPVSDQARASVPPAPADALTGPAEKPYKPSARGLKHLLQVAGLRRLVTVRLLTSFGDGAFQGALANAVLFDPSHRSTPADIAAGFAVLLLPYSLIGPFAGALLDRWSRRSVIIWANLIRSVVIALLAVLLVSGIPTWVLFTVALVVIGASRFVGSGLSASLPHVIANDSLVGGQLPVDHRRIDRRGGRRRLRHRPARRARTEQRLRRHRHRIGDHLLRGIGADGAALLRASPRTGRDRRTAGADEGSTPGICRRLPPHHVPPHRAAGDHHGGAGPVLLRAGDAHRAAALPAPLRPPGGSVAAGRPGHRRGAAGVGDRAVPRRCHHRPVSAKARPDPVCGGAAGRPRRSSCW